MRIQLPIQFENRMKEMLGEEFDDFINAYEDSNYHGLRINPLKAGENTESEIKNLFEARRVPWCSTGYYYEEEKRPGRHPYHHAGVYYIQEPSAMLVGELAKAVIDGECGSCEDKIPQSVTGNDVSALRILDLCAAPGGKTSHLAGLMRGRGVLVANEIVPSRAKILSQNVERMGIGNCIVTNENPDRLAATMPGYFDIIVVDTPCSGEGMFRRDEIARTEWSPANVEMCAQRGQDILNAADKMLAYGGTLIYSTCTFAPDEDEQAIVDFISRHPEYHIEKVNLQKCADAHTEDGWLSEGRPQWCADAHAEDIRNTFRLWPHKLHGEGHFAAVLKKGTSTRTGEKDSFADANPNKAGKGKKDQRNQKNNNLTLAVKKYEEFAEKFFAQMPNGKLAGNSCNEMPNGKLAGNSCNEMPNGKLAGNSCNEMANGKLAGNSCNEMPNGEFAMFGDNLYLIPKDAPRIDRLRIERAGLHLGELKKDRFEPSHALAMNCNINNCRAWHNITDEKEMVRYLCGESLQCDTSLSGWCIVCFNGHSAGLGKASNGVIKNHYPKGLRIKM